MIHILHGDNTEKSRWELIKLKEAAKLAEVITFDGKTVSFTDLDQALYSNTLFGSDRLVIIELLFRRLHKKSTELAAFSEWFKKLAPELHIIFWEDKELTKTQLALFPKKTDIALFKIDKNVFAFTESLRPGNGQKMQELLHLALLDDAAELIFALLVRQLRLLIMVSDRGQDAVQLAPWQASKLVKQASFFRLADLVQLYRQLLVIDGKIKTSNSPFTLSQELELFVTKI